MDLSEINTRLFVGREFEHAIGKCVFELRLPHADEARLFMGYFRAVENEPAIVGAKYQRAVLACALVGWRGVTTRDFLKDAEDDDPVAWAPRAVPMLMHAQPDWAVVLGTLVVQKLEARADEVEAHEKN